MVKREKQREGERFVVAAASKQSHRGGGVEVREHEFTFARV
jgi:hypothetical protein